MQEIKVNPEEIHPKTLVICREAPSQITAEDAIDMFGASEVWLPFGKSDYLTDLRYAQIVERNGRLINEKKRISVALYIKSRHGFD